MKLWLRTLVFFAAFSLGATSMSGQTDSTAPQAVEVHEGIFGMVSYFGGKLVDELAQRLNLSSEDSTKQKVPTLVVVKVAGVGFERVEMREAESK